MSKNTLSRAKPLKGNSLDLNSANISDLTLSSLNLPSSTLENLMNGIELDGVTIVNSEIYNSIIGKNGSNQGYFTSLTTTGDVILYTVDKSKDVSWDSQNGILTVNGQFVVEGCATIGNIEICQNTIQAINTNGDINIKPNALGHINLTGPITNIVNSVGNYLTTLANGNVTFSVSDYISLNSSNAFLQANTFSNQTFNTVNGDISLNTETGIGNKLITNITYTTSGNIQITSSSNSNIKSGDTVTLSNTNSVPNIDGVFKVTNVVSPYVFNISSASILSSDSTSGQFIKTISNSINLNAALYVKIPDTIPLTFGNTNVNIYSSSGNLLLNTNNSLLLNVLNKILIPQGTFIQLGSSANNYMNFDGNVNVNSSTNVNINGNAGYFNLTDTFFTDPNPLIANYTQTVGDTTDRGIQFRYYSGTSGNIGWFGYKQSTGKFTFLQNAVNNNEIITGTPSSFDIGAISVNNISLNNGGTFDANCGTISNVKLITGCSGVVNINGSSNVNISSGSRIALISGGDIYIPNNIPLLFSNNSFIKETTNGNLLASTGNIVLNANTIQIPKNTKLIFDGSTFGNQYIVSDSVGNLRINSNSNLYLSSTNGNVILPASISNTASSIIFGNSTENLYASTSGMFLNSTSSFGNINIISNSSVNISSSVGNILLNSLNGDVNLYSTVGNVRLYQNSRVVFGISGTSNSIRSNSIGSLVIYGSGNNLIELKNAGIINLTASTSVNIPTNTVLNLDSAGTRFLLSENANLDISNNVSSGNINITTFNTNVNNSGSLNIINTNTNISGGNFTLNTNNAILNTTNIKMLDPILTLANYTTQDNKDRGIEYNWYNTTTGSTRMGWFGYKNSTGQFTYYSDSINNNEVISGTLGQFALGSVVVSNSVQFLNTGNIDMNCGTISNLNTLTGCHGAININASTVVNVSSSSVFLNSSLVQIPFSTPLSFGSTSNNISTNSNGVMVLTAGGGNGTIILNSNVQVNGTTENVFSTVTNYTDPIISIGGINTPISNDLKDRGIEFKWNSGSVGNTGFFGFQNSTNRFIYMTNDTNNNEIVTGAFGDMQFNNGFLANLNVNCGTIANVSVLTGCNNTNLSIVSSSVNISASNINIPVNSKLLFGSNFISSDTSGNLNINSVLNTNIVSNSGGINLTTNTNGSGFVALSQNSPLTFGNASSGNFIIRNTAGDTLITNSTGNIYINPKNNVIIPTSGTLVFGNTTTSISSDGQNLQLYGYNIGINSSTVTIGGNVNIIGSISALSTSVDNNQYILPLGTQQQLGITSISNSSNGNINITTSSPNYLQVGDSVTIKNTNSTPVVDNTYIVNGVVNNSTFSVQHTSLSAPGTTGTMYSVLTIQQSKDVGIETQYWQNTTGNGVTSGSQFYETGFFGMINNSAGNNRFIYYQNATISSNVVTNGILGDMQANKLYTNKMSGFSLEGPIQASTQLIAGSNFQIAGGNIDNVPIGISTASPGRFTNLSSTISTNLSAVTLSSTLNYSIDRFTVSSLVPIRSPITSAVISYITVSGVSFTTSSGTMGSSGITDGQIKKIIISGMGNNCLYTLFFGAGKLNTPGTGTPTKMIFKSKGQSCELCYDATAGYWDLTGGNGCLVV
jgi:hypothetical protein